MSAHLSKDVLRAAFAMPVVASGKWNLLLPRGTFYGPNLKKLGGSLTIDDTHINACIASWVSSGKPQIAVYKTHRHLDKDVSPVERLELEKAYGFITDMRATQAGLECFVEWNQAGLDAIKSGEWAFWSAEWDKGLTNLLTGEPMDWVIFGAALTNSPFFDVLPPLAASADAVNGGNNTKSRKGFTMEELLKQVAEMLKGENKAAVAAALKAMIDEAAGGGEVEVETAAPPIPPKPEEISAAVTAAVKPLESAMRASKEQVEKLQNELLDNKVDAEVLKLKAGDGKRGRIVSDELIVATKAQARSVGLEKAIAFMKSLAPEGPPLTASGVTGKDEGKPSQAEANEKLDKLASELRAKGTKDARIVAMRENPELALIASGRN